MQLSPDLLNLDRLTRIIRASSSRPEVTIVSWQSEPIAYASVGADSRGLFRVSANTLTEDQSGQWEVVLKVFRPLQDHSTTLPNTDHYWKREALAYTSGLLASLPESISIPRCYEVEEMVDGSLWLWLEKVQSVASIPWPLSRFRLAAHHLGLFNGQFLARPSLPEYEWLSDEMTRIWADENAYTLSLIEQTEGWDRSMLRLAFPRPVRQRLLHLWNERQAYYSALKALPRTICHHDAGHRNLFATRNETGAEQTLLIDWELVGYGAIGEELGNLFGPALINFEVDPLHAEEFASALLDGYIEGLRSTGWRGDPQMVRLGFALSAVFRWVFAAAGWPVAINTDTTGRAQQQTLEQWGRPMEQVYQQWAGLTYFLLDLADQVDQILKH